MAPTLYTVQASVFGIGWVTFWIGRDEVSAQQEERAAVQADDKIWPGTAPRKTRILVDGKPPLPKTPTTLTEIFA